MKIPDYYHVHAWTIVNGQPELMAVNMFFSKQEAIERTKYFIKQCGFHVWLTHGSGKDNIIFEY